LHQPTLAAGTPKPQTLQYQEISSLHRSSPLATQQSTTTCLPHRSILSAGERLRSCCSTLVSRRRLCPPRVLCATAAWGQNDCNQPPPTFGDDACDYPLRRSGQQPSETLQTTRSHSSRLAVLSRAPATPGSAHATATPAFDLSQLHPSNVCHRHEGTLLTSSSSLRRGHHLEHFLCQGCHGKLLWVCSGPAVPVQPRLHCVEGRAFPALGSATITPEISREPTWRHLPSFG
jgi:hypothetical protein